MFFRAVEHLQRQYEISSWTDPADFLTQLARHKGKLMPNGEPDLNTVAKIMINDWQRGKLPFFVAPPRAEGAEGDEEEDDEEDAEEEGEGEGEQDNEEDEEDDQEEGDDDEEEEEGEEMDEEEDDGEEEDEEEDA